jgi:uncharacterized protein YbjQ (UPF0145 family)
MATWLCRNCGWQNAEKWDKCAKCGMSKNPSQEEIYALAQEKDKANRFLITTTATLQGKSIKKYYGIVTSFVALGTGLLSDLNSTLADFTGSRSNGYQKKLDEATNLLINELVKKTAHRNEEINALIGLKLDYTSMAGSNMMLVCGTATAVQYEDIPSHTE